MDGSRTEKRQLRKKKTCLRFWQERMDKVIMCLACGKCVLIHSEYQSVLMIKKTMFLLHYGILIKQTMVESNVTSASGSFEGKNKQARLLTADKCTVTSHDDRYCNG